YVECANQQDNRGSAPNEIKSAANTSHQDILKTVDLGIKAGIDQQLFELWKAVQVCGVDRIDLLPCLFDRRPGFQTSDVGQGIMVPVVVGLLLGAERKRHPESRFRIDELKTS